jgi:predicted cation transporter
LRSGEEREEPHHKELFLIPTPCDLLLWAVVLAVLVLPFAWRRVERNIELFLLLMGALATTASGLWSWSIVYDALRQPVRIAVVVLVVGTAFQFGRSRIDRGFQALGMILPTRLVIFLIVFALGFLASVLTAIIASLILVEVIQVLRLGRRLELRVTILACYAIGLGAALTPVGEPLSAVVTAKLGADFWFLARLLGMYIAPGILAVSVAAAAQSQRSGPDSVYTEPRNQTHWDGLTRAFRVYAFVAALVLLGAGLAPLVDTYVSRLPSPVLFWVNAISAILDNATLAAAETGPALTSDQLTAILLSLLISGGMLIPGNIPNIIAANHLKIRSTEWARFAVPVGLVLLTVCFSVWMALR